MKLETWPALSKEATDCQLLLPTVSLPIIPTFPYSDIPVKLPTGANEDVISHAFDRLNLQALQVFHLHALARETADGV